MNFHVANIKMAAVRTSDMGATQAQLIFRKKKSNFVTLMNRLS